MTGPQTPGLTLAESANITETIMAEAAALGAVLEEANEVRWSLPPRRRPAEDTSERSSGPHSDPTADIVTDERRLALSTEVDSVLTGCHKAVIALQAMRRSVERRLAEWGADHE